MLKEQHWDCVVNPAIHCCIETWGKVHVVAKMVTPSNYMRIPLLIVRRKSLCQGSLEEIAEFRILEEPCKSHQGYGRGLVDLVSNIGGETT